MDFYDETLIEEIIDFLEHAEFPSRLIRFEITETSYVALEENVGNVLNKIKEKGAWILLDDFGSGYSSLNTLKDMDVDVLKIDMGFLRTTKPEHLERSMKILNMIISLSKMLGLSVITEGVETQEQVVKLSQMGCGIYQGYYFSKPIPVSEFEERYM